MLVEMRHAPDPRLLLEVALVQLTHDASGADLHSLMSRLERLEQTVAAGAAATPAPRAVPTDPNTGRATIGGRARRDAASGSSAGSGAPGHSDALGHPSQSAPAAPSPASTIGSGCLRRQRASDRRSGRRRQPDPDAVRVTGAPGVARHGQGHLHGRPGRHHGGRRIGHQFRRRATSAARRGVPARRREGPCRRSWPQGCALTGGRSRHRRTTTTSSN